MADRLERRAARHAADSRPDAGLSPSGGDHHRCTTGKQLTFLIPAGLPDQELHRGEDTPGQ
jgi:hypothetical protein